MVAAVSAAVTVPPPPEIAAADTDSNYRQVSNTGETALANDNEQMGAAPAVAKELSQPFTTGNFSGSYVIDYILVAMPNPPTGLGGVGAGIYTGTTATTKVVDLEGPYDTHDSAIKKFYPTSDGSTIIFNNSTEYNVRFTYDGQNVALSSTTSDSEYVAPSSGWSIRDVSHYITNNNKLRR